uniref:FAD-binding domain-containing protein n=1 Tax=Bionectria ochroleuca TaxID=29856 RepID=A0A8H7K438_BIOOC
MTSIVPSDTGVKVYFADGTDYEFDAVIGADGVFSTVRDLVLSDESKQYSASPAGFWDCRVLVPFEKAKMVLGEELFKLDRQYGWAGDGAFILHDVLENGTLVQCVISAVEDESPRDRKHLLTREFLNKILASWLDGPIASGIIDLVMEQDDPRGYSEREHKATPTYARGRVCIMGDAAHASTPFQGAGAGQAFEDGMILSALLGHISSPDDIEVAFKIYDEIRRPRGQRVIDSSRGTGQIMCGRSEAGLDPGKIVQAVAPRWDFLNLDFKSYVQEAVQKLDERLRA